MTTSQSSQIQSDQPPCSPQSRQRPRVVAIAYCCSPYEGSEPGVGWNLVTQIAKYADIWVIVETHKFQAAIERYLTEHGPIPGLNFVFVAEKAWAHTMWQIPGMGYVSYNWWHQRAFQVARTLHKTLNFDLAHQINIMGFREPGYLHQLDIPFLWGPIGGTQNFPLRFLNEAGWVGGTFELLRTIMNSCQLRLSPKVRQAARKSVQLVAAGSVVRDDLATITSQPIDVISDISLPSKDVPLTSREHLTDGLRILWSGSFLTRKALSLLLKSIQQLPPDVPVKIRVLGDGCARKRWQAMAEKLGLKDRIEWLGWMPRDQAVAQLGWADVFAFTSLRDTTGTVMLEALQAGLPIICLDHQGAADVVTPACGIKVKVTHPRQVVADLAAAIIRLYRDDSLRMQMASEAQVRALDYDFERQATRWKNVYERILGPLAVRNSKSVEPTMPSQHEPKPGATCCTVLNHSSP